MSADPIRKTAAGYMPELDALRGIAILWVILHNAALHDVGQPQSSLMKLVELIGNTGWVGVQLFFVLSGFLITGILLDGRGTQNQFGNFYMRRTLRIFPLYYVFLITAFVILPWLGMVHWHKGVNTEQVFYWTYLSNWSLPFLPNEIFPHLWSLAIEEQFYLFWPLCVIFLGNRTLTLLSLLLVGTAVMTRALLVHEFPPSFSHQAMYTFTPARWDSLAMGALLALAVRNQSALSRVRALLPAVLITLTLVLLVEVAILKEFSASGTAGIWNQTVIAGWFALLILACISPGMRALQALRTIIAFRALRWVGKYSYAIYLFHFPAKMIWFSGFAVAVAMNAPWQQIEIVAYNFVGIALLATAAAYLSWRVLESPFLRLKRYFASPAMTHLP